MPRPGEAMSDEQRARIADALRGRPKPDEHRQRIAEGVRAYWQRRREAADTEDEPGEATA